MYRVWVFQLVLYGVGVEGLRNFVIEAVKFLDVGNMERISINYIRCNQGVRDLL